MKEKFAESVKIWKFDNLSNYSEIDHYISGRAGGVSEGEIGSLNLSFKVGDLRENVIENRRRLASTMKVDEKRLVFPSQTHSINVKEVIETTHDQDLEDTDALITNRPGVLISVMSADCVPVLLYDKINNAVAAIHAGWRGSVGKIVTHTIDTMKHSYGSKPENIIAGIGPSICQQVYEVGEEVLFEVAKVFGERAPFINKKIENPRKGYINLWEINRAQLLEAGVLNESIEIGGICTYSNSNDFFSARKSGNKAGRFAAGIMIRGRDKE